MNTTIRNNIKAEMAKYNEDDFNLFAAEYGWADWMNDYTDATEYEGISESESRIIDDILMDIWKEAHDTAKTIRSLRGRTGLSQVRFSELYHIPIRTIEDWERGERKPAPYLVDLLTRAVEEDKNFIVKRHDDGSVWDDPNVDGFIRVPGHFDTYTQVADAFNEAMDPDEPYTAEVVKDLAKGGYVNVFKNGAIVMWL